jgi:Domain of unknown function (DUF4864)
MRIGLYAVLTAAVLTLPVKAQEQPIQNTIQSQLDALARDDFATAFTYASPTIKGMFVTPENFGLMVSQGYPMVHHPAAVRMLELRTVAGNLWQRVMITDVDGKTHLLDYMMVETTDGWQINAVQLLRGTDVGA